MSDKTNERSNAFAGEKVPSMKRRSEANDYHERRIYMITMVTEGRRPLLGRLEGDVNAPRDSAEAPHVTPSPLGEAVTQAWRDIPRYHPEVRVMAFQLMPDHIHGILFVERHLEVGLGKVILGFKQGCNKAFRRLLPQLCTPPPAGARATTATTAAVIQRPTQQEAPTVEYGAVLQRSQQTPQTQHPQQAPQTQQTQQTQQAPQTQQAQQTQQTPQPAHPQQHPNGFLFEHGYHDRILLREGQLDTMCAYIADNPYRLAMKRAHPELLRVRTDINVCGRKCSAVGNLTLLRAPQILQVRFSRSIDTNLLAQEKQRLLDAARDGAVLVSPSISPGEKATMRAAFDAGYPLIVLLDNGIDPMSKPSGRRFRATAEGRLLLLSPFPHSGERHMISRSQCNQLNALAWDIAHATQAVPTIRHSSNDINTTPL